LDAIYPELTVKPESAAGAQKFTRNLVRFGTVGMLDGLQVIESKAVGA
jgi:hypothetical protein